jgi:hypothetical protein
MRSGLLLLVLATIAVAAPDQPLEQVLSRVSEEAEVFRMTAPKVLAREKLVQRAVKPPRRFHPRLGNAALAPPKPQYRTREVISEYAFATLKESPGVLHEFRQVISVDDRPVLTEEKARRTLTSGLRSDDDAAKKHILESFEKHGLMGAAADFGQLLLLFTRHRLKDYEFAWAGEGQVGSDHARIVSFKQTGGAGSLVIFDQRSAIHQPLEGRLWVRDGDGVPLRIEVTSHRDDHGTAISDQAQVDYLMAPQGYLLPASVTHRQTRGALLVVENNFQYSGYRMFQADADIKFN